MTFESLLLFILSVYGIGVALSQSLMSLGSTLLLVLCLVQFLRTWHKPAKLELSLVWVCLSFVFFSIGNLLSRDWDARSLHTLGCLPLVALPIVPFFFNKISEKKFEIPILLNAVSLLIGVAYSFWQYFALHSVAGGFLKNPIYYAYNLAPAFVFYSELFLRKKRFGRLAPQHFMWISLAVLSGIVLSENRMVGAFALAYLFGRVLLHFRKQFGKKIFIAAPLLCLLIGTSLFYTQPRFREKMERTFSGADPSLNWRLRAWEYNWDLWKSHPIAGVGPEKNGIDVAQKPELMGHWQGGFLIFAHSIYFQALGENGAIGLLLLLCFLFCLYRQNSFTASLVICLAVTGFSENVFNNSKAIHAFYFYLLFSLLIEKRRHAPIKPVY